jgi:hypothetical protein
MARRVQRKGETQCGVVTDSKVEDNVLMYNVHWGTDQRGPITEWIPDDDLEPFPHTVVGDDA